MKLRPATLSDEKALFALHEEVFREHIERIWGWDDEWQITNFQKEWGMVITEVIEDGEEVSGYLQIRQELEHLYVLNIALSCQHQNQGFGTQVIEILKKRAEAQGLPIKLNVFRTNERVIKFYERAGYKIYETTETGCKMGWSNEAIEEDGA